MKDVSAPRLAFLVALILLPPLQAQVKEIGEANVTHAPKIRLRKRLQGARFGEAGRHQIRQRLRGGLARQDAEVPRHLPGLHPRFLHVSFRVVKDDGSAEPVIITEGIRHG